MTEAPAQPEAYEIPANLLEATIVHLLQSQSMAQVEGLVNRLRGCLHKPIHSGNGALEKVEAKPEEKKK